MQDVTGLAALDVAIGLSFLFVVLSVVCAAINELIATGFRLRSRNLAKGIENLVGDESAVDRFFNHPRIQALEEPGSGRRPSYLPPRVFALTFLDTLWPHDMHATMHGSDPVDMAKAMVGELPPRPARIVLDALDDARGDAERLITSLERSFDEVMGRASGWYKRRVQRILVLVAVVIAGAGNVDSVSIGERLWKDDSVRAIVVAEATSVAGRTAPSATAVQQAAARADGLKQLGIPLGWTDETTPDDVGDGLGKLLGLLMTVFAVSLGAPFWFDVLGKVARLRGAGRRETSLPEPAAPGVAKPRPELSPPKQATP
jgi:hypothetical protein